MFRNADANIINFDVSIKVALEKLNELEKLILFVLKDGKLVGTLTDGDIRRGFIKSLTVDNVVGDAMNTHFHYLSQTNLSLSYIESLKKENITILPFIDANSQILGLVDFSKTKSLLPIDAIIMAGGRGERLKPLTNNCPKPMLKIGDKPIIEHNIDRLIDFGVYSIFISVMYLAEQIEEYFQDGKGKGVDIKYLREYKPLGTLGSVAFAENFLHDHVLITNSDILTNIDYEDFFKEYLESGADMAIAAIPYHVNIPYAVFEMKDNEIVSLCEKPTYTYYSNAGIYLVKREHLRQIKKDEFLNATDFVESLITQGNKVITYPVREYWLDIGRHEDFSKAQEDIKHIKF
jgi:dTDP-glucose pyrophosphorylase